MTVSSVSVKFSGSASDLLRMFSDTAAEGDRTASGLKDVFSSAAAKMSAAMSEASGKVKAQFGELGGEIDSSITDAMTVFNREIEAGMAKATADVGAFRDKYASAMLQMDAASKSAGAGAEESAFGNKIGAVTSGAGGIFNKLGAGLGAVGLPFAESFSKMGEKISDAETEGKKFSATMQEVGKVSLVAGAAGFAVAGAEAVHLDEAFQQATANMAAKADIPVKAAQKISDAFLGTAGSSTFSAQEMADAYGQVAGQLATVQGHALNAAQATQVMKAASDLAEASGESLSSTTTSLAAVMQAYGIKTGDASKAADTLFAISRETNQPVSTLTTVLDRLKGRLGDLAPSLQDVGALMAFPAVASQGSRGAMVVNTALQTLIGGSKSVTTELDSLGVHIFDSSGKFVGMRDVIAQLQPKLAGMSDQQRDLAEKTLFGSSAAQLMGQVVAGGVSAYDSASDSVSKLGSAHEAAEKQASTFHGTLEKLKATGEDLGVSLGQKLIPILSRVGQVIADVINWFEKHKAVAEAVGIAIGILVAGPIAMYIASMVTAAAATLVAAAPFIAIIAAATAVGVAIYELVSNWSTVWGEIKAVASDVWKFLDGIWHGIEGDIKTIWGDIEGFFKRWWPEILGVFTAGIGLVVGEVIQHWQSIENFFTGFPGRMASVAEHMWDWIWAGLKAAEDFIANLWNSSIGSLSFHIPSWVPGIGGDGFSMPKIPVLDSGGIITQPTLAMLALNNVPEAVIPLSQAGQPPGAAGKSITNNVYIEAITNASPDQIAQAATFKLSRLIT